MILSVVGVLCAGGVAGFVNTLALEGTPNQVPITITRQIGTSTTTAVPQGTTAPLGTGSAAATAASRAPRDPVVTTTIVVRPTTENSGGDTDDSAGDRSADD